MSKTIQVRNVPDGVHHRLTVRAAEERKSLSELVLQELVEVASRPTMEQMLKRLEGREPVELDRPVAEIIAGDRRERDDRVAAASLTGRGRPDAGH